MFTIIATLLVFIFTLLFVLNWQRHSYWKTKGVPTPTFLPLLGHYIPLLTGYRWDNIHKMYNEHKSQGLWGLYLGFKPELYISDLELLKSIMVKDADHFTDRRPMQFSNQDKVFNEMLSLVQGEKWKALRSIMTPTFTSGKMKGMFPLIVAKGDELLKECEVQMKKNSYLEMKSLFSFYTMDVIGTCAFGIDAHCIENKENSQFIKSGSFIAAVDLKKILKLILITISPKLSSALGITFFGKQLQYFEDVAKETVALRKKSGQKRGDFLDLLLEALEESEAQSHSKYPMSMNTIISQSVLFLVAGFDTTANTLSFLAYLLAKNPDVQKRLRKELQKSVEADGELNYQNVMESHYLDACLSETLRIYAPAHVTERSCSKTYNVPGRDLEIPKGMMVGIPIYSLHHDPDYWEDPESFLPERFLPANKENIKPYTYMPFGLGPRNCIAMRFAQLETKLAIAQLCLAYEMDLRPGYTELVLEKTFNTLRANKDGVQLVMKKIVS